MQYKEVDGDLIELANNGEFDIIAHGCNCFCTMGAGIAPQMAKAFGCDQFPQEHELLSGDIRKLGNIDFRTYHYAKNSDGVAKNPITVINAYTQFGPGFSHYGKNVEPLHYRSLILCFEKINYLFKGKHIGLPQIGCGLAGGDWEEVKKIIQRYLIDMDITVVNYKPKQNVPKHKTNEASKGN